MNTLPDLLLQTLASRVAFAPDGTTTAGMECLLREEPEAFVIALAGLTDRHTRLERPPEEVVPQLPRLQFAFIDSSPQFDFTMMEFVLVETRRGRTHRAA